MGADLKQCYSDSCHNLSLVCTDSVSMLHAVQLLSETGQERCFGDSASPRQLARSL